MDGVTVDTEPLWQRSEFDLMGEFGYAWRKEDEVHCLGGPLSRVGEYMSSLVGRPYPGSWFTQRLIEIQLDKLTSETELLPGVLHLIKSLRELAIPIGLVSASPRSIIDAVFQSLPSGLFDFSISSDDVAQTKPNPEPYLRAAEVAKVDITQTLVIEDSATGIKSGYSAGAYVVAVPHFIEVREGDRIKVISSLLGQTPESLANLFN